MKTHDLKILPEYFEAVTSGMKTFELRKDDRGFATGDHVVLWEWDGEYTGRSIGFDIGFVLRGYTDLEEGYVIFGLVRE